LLFQNNIPKIYWSDAVLTATYLINRLPSVKLKNMSPLEILKERKIDMDHIRVFGCTCFVHIKRNDKLDRNSVKTIFLGYSSGKKGYKCYDPKNHKLYISRDVSFIESEPYYQSHKPEPTQPTTFLPNSFLSPHVTIQEQVEPIEEEQIDEPSAIPSGGEIESSGESTQEEIALRRSTRQIRPSVKLRDYVSHQVMYLIQNYISYKKVSPEYQTYLGNITNQLEPTTFAEANQSPIWKKAMKEELQVLEKNNTWDIITLPKNKKNCRV
jgi:hypothetical protein